MTMNSVHMGVDGCCYLSLWKRTVNVSRWHQPCFFTLLFVNTVSLAEASRLSSVTGATFQTLIHTIRQILVVLQTTLGQRQCRNAVCASIAIVM